VHTDSPRRCWKGHIKRTSGTVRRFIVASGIAVAVLATQAPGAWALDEASLITCGAQGEPLPFGSIAHLKFTLVHGGATLKFTAKSILAIGGLVATCPWTFKRTDVTNPNVGGCAP